MQEPPGNVGLFGTPTDWTSTRTCRCADVIDDQCLPGETLSTTQAGEGQAGGERLLTFASPRENVTCTEFPSAISVSRMGFFEEQEILVVDHDGAASTFCGNHFKLKRGPLGMQFIYDTSQSSGASLVWTEPLPRAGQRVSVLVANPD